jgi:Phage gp6-like head-tail connector protein
MILSTQIVTPPIVEPVTLDQAKLHLRVDFDDDDTLITALITAAREYAERRTRRAFFNQTWMRTLDFFPLYGKLEATRNPSERYTWPYGTWYWDQVTLQLPYPRTLAVTGITYLDNNADQQTLLTDAYNVDATCEPARITPAQGMFWPILNNYIPGSVVITFVAGSYVKAITGETFTVPSSAPYTYTPAQSPVTAITSLVDGEGHTPSYMFTDGVLTFSPGSAGLSYTLDYYAGTCPLSIQQAMLLLIGHWYQHREAVSDLALRNVPTAADALLDMHAFHIIEYR